ncbi:glycerophosphoryl diester phosphodiesterase [Paenibacillus sp. V4I3]|uniref:glycerophosphodiester phosphodiesterase n=1 Tax=unclassified Paenibacillus TaxID=185978 RepID=UPI0027887F4D|nr:MULTISPECIES: glycerophosphodiester phosphodiesterase [unclassified Paenibacillus]MDQ0878680.1 glycerophosphoryl diester phosphodiesterase [Paenibacillus sp. V4I3]MDQ0885463.1 glycerophosphoryl diester phosphodiesterase [Paenibacillus sp. V4I9]
MTKQPLLVIAHRGARGEAPENTLAAFRLGLEQGCDAIELDIHLSKDGEIVVIHDDTLNRTTDINGRVNELTLTELKQADAGRWFHEKYACERVPLLEEVFDLVPANVIINVEIKHSYGRKIEPALVELMKRKNRMQNVIVSSFDHKCLLFLKLLEPEIKIGLLYDINPGRHIALATGLGFPVYSLHPKHTRIVGEDVRDAIAQGLRVFPYTINDEERMAELIDYGVSGIITDYPRKLRAMLSHTVSAGAER